MMLWLVHITGLLQSTLIYVYSITEQAENAIIICGQILDGECNSDSIEIALESKYDRSAPSLAYLSYVGMYRKLHIDGIWTIM